MGGMGGSSSSTHSSLQARISSVDDLRQGGSNCNSISKSQVRLMREMFEQQQQKLNSKNFNSSEGGKMLKSNAGQGASMTSSTSSLNRKYSNEETGMLVMGHGQANAMHSSSLINLNGGGMGGDAMDGPVHNNNKPPAIQPCSGVLELVSDENGMKIFRDRFVILSLSLSSYLLSLDRISSN